jgi:hypothetical protein
MAAFPIQELHMTLYVDYTALQSNAGPCALAYVAMQLAGGPLKIVYTDKALPAMRDAYGHQLKPPVLLIDDGQVIHSLPEILVWARRDAEHSRV